MNALQKTLEVIGIRFLAKGKVLKIQILRCCLCSTPKYQARDISHDSVGINTCEKKYFRWFSFPYNCRVSRRIFAQTAHAPIVRAVHRHVRHAGSAATAHAHAVIKELPNSRRSQSRMEQHKSSRLERVADGL